MRINWGRQAASVVRAPNWIRIDLACQRWRSRIIQMDETVHGWIEHDLDDDPRMMQADVPPEPDDWVARLARELQRSEPPAPAEDELHAGATVAVPVATTGRSFWSYAEPAMK